MICISLQKNKIFLSIKAISLTMKGTSLKVTEMSPTQPSRSTEYLQYHEASTRILPILCNLPMTHLNTHLCGLMGLGLRIKGDGNRTGSVSCVLVSLSHTHTLIWTA